MKKNGNNQTPYVSYQLEAKIHDKGVGYTIKRAIDSFKEHHKDLAIGTRDFHSDSKTFRVILEIYDNGCYDFNLKHLLEHIDKSGSLPSIEQLRPKIQAKPLENKEYKQPEQNNKSDQTWIKTLEKLNEQLDEKNKELKEKYKETDDLNETLNQKQNQINEFSRKVSELEKIASESKEIDFSNPAEVLAKGILPKSLETIAELESDYNILQNQDDIDLVLGYKKNKSSLNRKDYLERKTKTTFTSQEEINSWIKEGENKTWEQSQEWIDYLRQIKEFETEKKLLKEAEERTSPVFLETMKNVVSQREKEQKQTESQIQKLKKDFELKQKNIPIIRESQKRYENFSEVVEKSLQREKSQSSIPMIVEIEPTGNYNFYFPSTEETQGFREIIEKELIQITKEKPIEKQHEKTFSKIKFKKNPKDRKSILNTREKITNIGLLNALGTKIIPTYIFR